MQTTTDNQSALAAIDRGLSRIHPHLWVGNRMRSLKAEAHAMRAGINIAKSSSIAGTLVASGAGLLLGGTGVALIGGGIGLLGYAAVMLADGIDTGRFAPLPFMRTRVADRIETLGSAETRALREQYDTARAGAGVANFEADEELYSNLPLELCNEALMLRKHGALVVRLLNGVEPKQRDLAYLHLCNAYETFGDSLTGMTPQRLQDGLQGQINGDYQRMRPADMHEYQPPAYQMPAPDQSFGELPAQVQPGVGSHTRLNAVNVSANDLAGETLTALKQYVQQPKNLLIVASGGAGKGITLANLIRFRHEANTTFVAIWCDPKNDAEESGLMSHAGIRAYRFSAGQMTPEEIADKMRGLVQFYRVVVDALPPRTPVWLVLDEWWYVMNALQNAAPELLEEILNMIRGIVSLLDADHKHMVIVTQSPLLKDTLPGCGGMSASMNTIGLFKRDDVGLKMLEKSAQCGVVPRSVATRDNLYQVTEQSPRNRAVYFDGELRPVPELTNYGNYDRDKKQMLSKASVELKNFADDFPINSAAPLEEFDADSVVPTAQAVEAIARSYERSTDAPSPIHPKAQRFAEVVAEYFELNPDKQSVGLGRLISDNKKLSDLRKAGKKDAIEKLMHLAAEAGLIQVEESGSGWSVSLANCHTIDELDMDF